MAAALRKRRTSASDIAVVGRGEAFGERINSSTKAKSTAPSTSH
jgi:hypothetical protein